MTNKNKPIVLDYLNLFGMPDNFLFNVGDVLIPSDRIAELYSLLEEWRKSHCAYGSPNWDLVNELYDIKPLELYQQHNGGTNEQR